MSLDYAQREFGWPSKDEILAPKGIGAAIYAQQAQEKIGSAIGRLSGGAGVRVGVLASDPDATAAPLAIVCDFPNRVSDETLLEAQKLAWNFSRSLLLITVEPQIIRKWTCCEPPSAPVSDDLFPLPASTPEVGEAIYFNPIIDVIRSASEQAAISLHWVDLLTGAFFQKNEARFKPEKRADQLLLSNLKVLRQKLLAIQLSEDICHDLLARIIFIQFLFDRKDTEGKAALSKEELLRLHEEEHILANVHGDFSGLLGDYEDTYALFRWLNSKFNGDLFPGKGAADEQDAAWELEKSQVKPKHLNLLARFVSGQEEMSKGQLSLWPSYAFDAIPFDVISTIYEQFVKKDSGTGVHYTPSHVADLMLDLVLPWEGQNWDLKVLDPSCGSGVFLVKAFQRLVYRWKNAHSGRQISGKVLTQLLEQNLFGVDLDAHAVRVASFSLYLAMCDEIDPRDYWKEVHFPVMRGRRLIAADFFEECDGFRTSDEPFYDLVIGNPPWGKKTATKLALAWESEHGWPLSYNDVGPLFLAKALALTKTNGCVGLLQSSTLLYKSTLSALTFRNSLFHSVQVEEVVNLCALRFGLFNDAIEPACVIILRNCPPTGEAFWYTCPKPLRSQEDKLRIVIDPQDSHQVWPDEVIENPSLWSSLLWGGRRDLTFIQSLSRYDNLTALEKDKSVQSREGIIRGDQKKTVDALLGRPFLQAEAMLDELNLFVRADVLPKNANPQVHSRDSTNFEAFELPQAIIRQSWLKDEGRFRAALVASDSVIGGVLCSHSYLSIHTEEKDHFYLEATCLTYNSIFAVYYLLLTSGRFAMYRPEPEAKDFRSVPLPRKQSNLLEGVATVAEVDERVRKVFDFKEAEWLLIEDLAQYTLPDFKGGTNSPGRLTTQRNTFVNGVVQQEPELKSYCNTFRRVLEAAYGTDKAVGTVIFSEPETTAKLPVRMVAIYLNVRDRSTVEIEALESEALQQRLTALYTAMLSTEENKHNFYQRCARTYDSVQMSLGENGILVNLIKPDQVRYWTRSMALRDADEVVADLLTWGRGLPKGNREREAVLA